MNIRVGLPEDLVSAVDASVGRAKRTLFITETVREKLRKENLLSALEKTAGILSAEKHPEWDTPVKVASWVRELRRG